MLIRIRKARKSPTGDILSISDYPDHNRATQLGIIEPPPNYKEGTYNTLFTKTTSIEDKIIYKERSNRTDPVMYEMMSYFYTDQTGD